MWQLPALLRRRMEVSPNVVLWNMGPPGQEAPDARRIPSGSPWVVDCLMTLIEEQTGHDELYWCHRIQELITAHSRPTDDPNHEFTDAPAWIAVLAQEVWDSFVDTGRPTDENMWTARTLSIILGCWYSSLQRAKFGSPTRPIESRQAAHGVWLRWQTTWLEAVAREDLHPVLFPHQPRDNPFDPDATDGSFV